MRIDINYLLYLQSEIDKINKIDLKDIEWFDNGVKLAIDPRVIEDFKFVGLTNINFILTGYYKDRSYS